MLLWCLEVSFFPQQHKNIFELFLDDDLPCDLLGYRLEQSAEELKSDKHEDGGDNPRHGAKNLIFVVALAQKIRSRAGTYEQKPEDIGEEEKKIGEVLKTFDRSALFVNDGAEAKSEFLW